MKRVCFISICILLLTVSFANSQMGGGMMGGQGDRDRMGGDMMGSQTGSGMMGGQEMMGGMMQNMSQMTGIMKQMTDMMKGTMDPAHMRKMSDIMKDMSEHMRYMSGIMSKGDVSQKEMEQIHQQMIQTQKRFDMMKMW